MVPPAAPTAKDDSEYTATYTLLVSLIRLSGGSLPEAKMERYLRRLGMEDNTPIASYTKTELLLKRMEKDGYLVKVKENATGQDEDISWSVGPRGKVEVGNRGVRGLVGQVYGDLDAEEAKELKRRAVRSLGEGERPPEKKADAAGGEKKKRGRKRRDEEKDEEEGDEEDDE